MKRFDWILPAYALMLNHFHFLIQLRIETLSRGLHWLNGEYASYFNERHERVGHVFQGRPHAPLIDEQTYFLEVLRYVVLNPVRAHIVATPEEYEWSSHRAVIGKAPVPDWLATDDVLAHFASDRDIATARYRCFVDAGIGLERTPWSDLVGQIYLGNDQWIAKVREHVRMKPRADDHPRAQRMVGMLAMADVVAAVAQTLSIHPERVRHSGVPRLIAAWIGTNEALLTSREIAAGLRLRCSGYIARLVRQCEKEIDSDPAVRALIDKSISTLRRKSYEL